jgi:hypothetical protein
MRGERERERKKLDIEKIRERDEWKEREKERKKLEI